MTNATWRPLGVEAEDEVAKYDALHEGVPSWMATAYWRWVRQSLTSQALYGRLEDYETLNFNLAEELCQSLRIPLPDLSKEPEAAYQGERLLTTAMDTLTRHKHPLQIADYLLAHGGNRIDDVGLDEILDRCKSAWRVGTRLGMRGLERRVPLGAQVAADAVMSSTGDAGVRLAKAWEVLYGINPDPSQAYSLAIKAVEDVAVPIVSPSNKRSTLGTVLKQMADQKNWELPMDRNPSEAPSKDVILYMGRLLWHGQHDRHGGQPSAPGNVSIEEATVAVSLAVTLVQWFHAGLVARATAP